MIMLEKINLTEKFASFKERWSPKVIGQVNDAAVKLAKLQGEFMWHSHANEDELFLVVKGKLLIKLRDQDIYLNEGECVIIPKGVEHLPIAEEECHVLFFEPNTTLNTGNIKNERTVEVLEKI
jgi:mannose-6-phosphate isomerase-like protein (cupin superfamily)